MSLAAFPPADAVKSSIFIAYASILINAPASVAWNILLSPGTWPEWNTFVPECQGASGKIKSGDSLRFCVSMPPSTKKPRAKRSSTTTDVLVDKIEEAEPDIQPQLYHAQWSRSGDWMLPTPLLRTVRHLYIESKGESQCEFRSYETFNGIAAYIIKYSVIAEKLMIAFEEWGKGLKTASEAESAAGR